MRRPVLMVLTGLLGLACYCSAAVRDSASVARELLSLEQKFGGHLGVAAKNFATGEVIRYRAEERFPTASAIKFPIMAAYFREVQQKHIDPGTRFMLGADDKKPGSGVLQFMRDSLRLTLADAVELMIILSDNTATNLVLDHLAPTHEARLRVVNDFLDSCGIRDTRLLNRLYSLQTKQDTPDAIRFGIGVATPGDMVSLLDRLYHRTLVDSASSEAMLAILKDQQDMDMLPRFLPVSTCKTLDVAHKTGSVNETKVDVGLVLSDRVNFAVAIFVDKHPDHIEREENLASLLAASAGRAVWNYFTGDTGYSPGPVLSEVDWNSVPGGQWGIYRTSVAPFPHKDRVHGFKRSDGTFYPEFPHYLDSSLVVFVPKDLRETPEGTNLIVHFHGHMYDDLLALRNSGMVQGLVKGKINALLVFPQGPYFARDSFGGKMEDSAGFRRMVENILATMKGEGMVKDERIGKIIVSGHSGGGRPVGFVLEKGGLSDHISDVFLFDALYEGQEQFKAWLTRYHGTIHACYTDYLVDEHLSFKKELPANIRDRFQCTKTTIEHGDVVQAFFLQWLPLLGNEWKLND